MPAIGFDEALCTILSTVQPLPAECRACPSTRTSRGGFQASANIVIPANGFVVFARA